MDETPGNSKLDAREGSNASARLSPQMRRALALAVIVAACAAAWGITLAQFNLSKGPREVEFGALSSDARVRLYVQPVQINPPNDSLEVRISVVPDPSLAEAASTIADRDFLLKVRVASRSSMCLYGRTNPFPK